MESIEENITSSRKPVQKVEGESWGKFIERMGLKKEGGISSCLSLFTASRKFYPTKNLVQSRKFTLGQN